MDLLSYFSQSVIPNAEGDLLLAFALETDEHSTLRTGALGLRLSAFL
jgi:hypothetical protein